MVAQVNKYHARKVVIDGITFASGLEGRRYRMLKLMERTGEITDLRLQVVYDLNVNGIKIGKYIADFVYLLNGVEIIEDAKGKLTQLFKRSAKHMAAQGQPVTIWPPRPVKTRKRRPKNAA